MRRAYKYRMYPNKNQRKVLDDIFHFCKDLYNAALEERKSAYKRKIKVDYKSQSKQLPELKKLFKEETKCIYSQIHQQVLLQLDAAYQNFFNNGKGFPRFKTIKSFNSICFPQANLTSRGGIKLLPNRKIVVFGIPGEIKVKFHRQHQGVIKQIRIVRKAGEYYLTLSCDEVPAAPLLKTGKTVAIDLGISSFITTDSGENIQHPRPYRTAKEKLAYRQKKLAAKKKNSNNYKKQLKLLQKAHSKIKNIREDFQHKTANTLIKENDIIILEKLNVKDMLKSKSKKVKKENITDAAWGNFIFKLEYKAESAGRIVVKVEPENTSKMCSNCGNIDVEQILEDRLYCCKSCGFSLDRDHNAAINIKNKGLGTSPAKQNFSEAPNL